MTGAASGILAGPLVPFVVIVGDHQWASLGGAERVSPF